MINHSFSALFLVLCKKITILILCFSFLSACGSDNTENTDKKPEIKSPGNPLALQPDSSTQNNLTQNSSSQSLATSNTTEQNSQENSEETESSLPNNIKQDTPQENSSSQFFPPWIADVFEPYTVFENKCVSPRFNITNPLTDNLYADSQGTSLDEKNWIRSWNDDVYLWYDEVIDQNPSLFGGSPIEYFATLKTKQTAPSGKPKDEFHFTEKTADYLNLSQSGVAAGYGMTLSLISQSVPRELVVAYTQPNSPATSPLVNIKRGTKILKVDGLDLINATDNQTIEQINAGLFPQNKGETHTFTIQDAADDQTRLISMTSSEVTIQSVQKTKVINTETGKVAYMQFNEHISNSEQQLIDAITEFKTQEVTDLILDLRYNSGGLIYIANLLASMIANPDSTLDKIFTRSSLNSKHQTINPFTGLPIDSFSFVNTTNTDEKLPNLDLSRVFIITGADTCSASELIINGLRGVDVDVIQIGSTTCGKPYGFTPTDNCGTSYFTVNFKIVNAKGFGDYADGFSAENESQTFGIKLPGCFVTEDYTHPLGDTNESKLAAALHYRRTGGCPIRSARSSEVKTFKATTTIKPLWLQNAITQ